MTDVDTSTKSNTKSTNNGDSAPVVVDKSFNRFIFLNLIFYILNSLVTYSIQFGWIDRPDNGELSDKYQSIVTPFGKSFLIWSVIFMWQLFWVIWQFIPSQRNSEGVIKAWYYYPIMTVFQAGWTISFSYEIMWLALIFMYGILATLIIASMSLQSYKKTWKGYMLWQGPFSLQTGWIMAASAVMTNTIPVAYNASTTGKLIVSWLSLLVLVVTAFSWLSSYPVDFAIPLVILWALGGVYAELQSPADMILNEFSTKQINYVQNGVLAGMCLVGVGIVAKVLYVLIKQRPQSLKEQQQATAGKKDPACADSESSASVPASAEEAV